MIATTAAQMLHDYGIVKPPIPVKEIVKQYAKLYYFDEQIDPDFVEEAGFTVYRGNMSYFVYINRGLCKGRDNFTLAHELGHIALHHLRFFDPYVASSGVIKLLDQEADKFATNLLMPSGLIKTACKFCPPVSCQNIAILRDTFSVSWQALMIRLDELNLQPYRHSQNILEKYGGGK